MGTFVYKLSELTEEKIGIIEGMQSQPAVL
jgi:hypothetical protein